MELLDLGVSTERLTQGRSPAEMTVAVQRAEPEAGSERRPRARASSSTASPARIDPYAIAERVYQLMRQDLATFRERRGPRR